MCSIMQHINLGAADWFVFQSACHECDYIKPVYGNSCDNLIMDTGL